MYVTGQHKNKQISDRLEYITHCINTHGQYTTPTCPKCAYKILQIFSRVFEFALAEKPRNPRKLMYRKYFCVYSISLSPGEVHYEFVAMDTHLKISSVFVLYFKRYMYVSQS